MTLFGKKIQIWLPEKAYVIEHNSHGEMECKEAFRRYRRGIYLYHGAIRREDGVYHLFYVPGTVEMVKHITFP